VKEPKTKPIDSDSEEGELNVEDKENKDPLE
jgi:hypothetical protein